MNLRCLFGLLILIAACTSDEAANGLCPACKPELGGDTGDLGGTPTACGYYQISESVDVTQALALDFDVDDLERRVAAPIDMQLAWKASESRGGGPALGYSTSTRVTMTVTSGRTYRHLRPDPQYCDGTTCRFPGEVTVPQASCPRTLEIDVTAQIATADDAVRGTLTGTAWRVLGGSEDGLAKWKGLVTARAKLSELQGKLRVHPDPGALGYRTWLQLNVRFDEMSVTGELSPNVLLEHGDNRATHYVPLLGSFPPVEHEPSPDAGGMR